MKVFPDFTIGSSLAWMGVWIVFFSFADYVIKIESNAYAMAWGIIALVVSNQVAIWVGAKDENPNK